MRDWLQRGPRTYLRHPRATDESAFVAASGASVGLHRRWVCPPITAAQYRRWLARHSQPGYALHLLFRREDHALCGALNLTEIVRGPLQSANLGYYAFAPHAGRGYMREGVEQVLGHAFGKLRLHRVEASAQPNNTRSIALLKGANFREEGYSPRFLKIAGRWRDHVRFAMTIEDWRTRDR